MANTSKNSLGYRINYREGTISVSERLIKEANREGIGSVAHTTLEALIKMLTPVTAFVNRHEKFFFERRYFRFSW